MKHINNLDKEWQNEADASALWDACDLMKTNSVTGLQEMKALAQKGSSLAMSHIGEIYLRGLCGVPKDIEVGVEWLEQSSSAGSIEASYLLARHHESINNIDEASDIYNRLSLLDFSPALFALGYINYKGDFGKKNIEKSIIYFSKAKNLGHLRATHWLSHIFIHENLGIRKKIIGIYDRFLLLFLYPYYKFRFPNSDKIRY